MILQYSKLVFPDGNLQGLPTQLVAVITALALLFSSGCDGDSGQPQPGSDADTSRPSVTARPVPGAPPKPDELEPHPPDPTRVADWETFTYRTVKILYPEGHPMESTFYTFANVVRFGQRQLAQFLSYPPALDTVTIYYYTGPGQSIDLVGTYHPFASDDGIHFTPPSPYGAPLAMYILDKWQQHPPKYKFLREGLIALFDLSGQDYFEQTRQMFADTTRMISLLDLAADTTVNVNMERDLSGPAATFVTFVHYLGGPAAYRRLYHHQAAFPLAVTDVLNMAFPEAEMRWRQFVRNPPEADTTQSTD